MSNLLRAPSANRQSPIPKLRVGCAGWSIPREDRAHFPDAGSHLERYAEVFNAVEINSSFYRTHLPRTYARWAASVPGDFRFSVKFPRSVSHESRLERCYELLEEFLGGAEMLGPKLGCLLLQLPPSLSWKPRVVLAFLAQLREMHDGPVVCEPRHDSWFHAEASRALASYRISRVAADPGVCPRSRAPAGDQRLQYMRLHGSPRMYHDRYAEADIVCLASRLQRRSLPTTQRWCIFDNTASGHAIPNALCLMARLNADISLHAP